MIQEIVSVFEKASIGFLRDQKSFILTGVSERSLCGELMKYLSKELSETDLSKYYVDVEYNRNKGGKLKTIKNDKEIIIPITCDIIIHSRGENIIQDNLIAIEMKKSSHSKIDKDKDRARLIALTKDSFDNIWSYDGKTFPEHVCRYQLGVYYEMNLEKRVVETEYYMKGELQKKFFVKF